jgi:hypothetical protein
MRADLKDLKENFEFRRAGPGGCSRFTNKNNPCNMQRTCPGRDMIMSLKENLLKKIEIDQLTQTVLASVGPVGSMKKVDKAAMTRLLETAGYQRKQERDLVLFYKEESPGKARILVLDNELPLYLTTIDDVVMRKSPTVKEIISIRNALKIMNDSDVVISRREKSVEAIQNECIETLDLSFTLNDLDEIEKEGAAAFRTSDSEGVIQTISLFSELLDYGPPPGRGKKTGFFIRGAVQKTDDRSIRFGPAAVYDPLNNDLKLFIKPVTLSDRDSQGAVGAAFTDDKNPSRKGADVFLYLKEFITIH